MDYIVFFEEFVESCMQNFLNNFRKTSEYRHGLVIIHVIFCSDFVDGDEPGNFVIARKIPLVNTKLKNKLRCGAITNLAALIKNSWMLSCPTALFFREVIWFKISLLVEGST